MQRNGTLPGTTARWRVCSRRRGCVTLINISSLAVTGIQTCIHVHAFCEMVPCLEQLLVVVVASCSLGSVI